MIKILFIRPKPSPETIGLQHVMIVEPLELEVLAGSLPDNDCFSVVVDMILEKKSINDFILEEKPDVLCVTGYITNVPAIIDYCRLAKNINHKIVTIVGGVHCEVCPEDLDDPAIDFRVVRNATSVFPLLIKHLRGKSEFPKGVLKAAEKLNLAELPHFNFYFPFPNRKLTEQYRDKYFYIFHDRVALVKTSFGCPAACNFCFCRKITDGKYHTRPIDDVITELKTIKEKNIYIVDDDFLTSRKRVEHFIRENRTANLQKQYLLYGRADFIANNPDLIKAFRAIGLKTIIVGFESFFDEELKQYNKEVDAKTNEEAMNVLNTLKIDCYATIIVSPKWGVDEFNYCKEKMQKLGIGYVNLQPLTPLPGTGSKITEDKIIIPFSDYAKWDLAHVTVRPEKMSVAEFYKNIIKLYNSILFQPKVLISYLKNYNILMLWKMIKGSFMVWKQYQKKIKEVKNNA